jgi:hypothetical protein
MAAGLLRLPHQLERPPGALPVRLGKVDDRGTTESLASTHLGPFSAPTRQPTLVGAGYEDAAVVLDRRTGEHVQTSPHGFDLLAALDGRTDLRSIARSVGTSMEMAVDFTRGLADRGWLQGYPRTLELPSHPHARARELA